MAGARGIGSQSCSGMVRVVGALALEDQVRPESVDAVRSLRDEGIRVVMITGDARQVADAVGADVGVDEVMAEVLPERQRRGASQSCRHVGSQVAMVGDGVNDAPALAQSRHRNCDRRRDRCDDRDRPGRPLMKSDPLDPISRTQSDSARRPSWTSGRNLFLGEHSLQRARHSHRGGCTLSIVQRGTLRAQVDGAAWDVRQLRSSSRRTPHCFGVLDLRPDPNLRAAVH